MNHITSAVVSPEITNIFVGSDSFGVRSFCSFLKIFYQFKLGNSVLPAYLYRGNFAFFYQLVESFCADTKYLGDLG